MGLELPTFGLPCNDGNHYPTELPFPRSDFAIQDCPSKNITQIKLISGRQPDYMSHSFSYENEKAGVGASKASDLLVQLDGEPDLASVYCSQCRLCNKSKVDSETKVNSVLVNGSSTAATESNKNVNNNVELSDKVVVEDSNTNSESRKTTTSRVVIDCDAIVSVPHSDDMKMMTSNGKTVSGPRSKKKKRGRQLLYSNGASSDLKDSSSQAGDKGSNDEEVNYSFNFFENSFLYDV